MFLISGSHIHISRTTCNSGFKKVIIYYNETHICYSILFSCYITSSSNITSVYSMEHILGVEKTITACLLGNKIYRL